MSEMIERVARAIFKIDYPDSQAAGEIEELFWDRKGRFYLEQARAAISAMREPTEAMLDSGSMAPSPLTEGVTYGEAERIYQAMIDEALKDK